MPMRWGRIPLIVLSALLLTSTMTTGASARDNRVVLLVIDISGSMAGDRLTQAKAALTASVDALPADGPAGLHSFGGECGQGGDLLVPIATGNRDSMREAIGRLTASGGTPTPSALQLAVRELPANATEGTIVLVSDGESSCGDPCPIVAELLRSSTVKFKAYTVGFQTAGVAQDQLRCIAEATNARYVAATDTADLQAAVSSAFTDNQSNPLPLLAATATLLTVAAIAATVQIRRSRHPYVKTRLTGPSLVRVEWGPRDDKH